jgi:hypothetical protein
VCLEPFRPASCPCNEQEPDHPRCNHQLQPLLPPCLLPHLPLAAGAAAAAVRRSRGTLIVQAVAATERPATKVTSQRYELPRGSRIEVRPQLLLLNPWAMHSLHPCVSCSSICYKHCMQLHAAAVHRPFSSSCLLKGSNKQHHLRPSDWSLGTGCGLDCFVACTCVLFSKPICLLLPPSQEVAFESYFATVCGIIVCREQRGTHAAAGAFRRLVIPHMWLAASRGFDAQLFTWLRSPRITPPCTWFRP